MSDETTTAATEAPVVDAPVVTETPATQDVGSIRGDAKANAFKTAEKLFNPSTPEPAQATADATGRLHAADGKFVEKTETQGATPPVTPSDIPAAPAPETVRIPLADDHPLRHRIGAEVEVPKALEELARFAINQPIKQKAVEEAAAKARDAEHRAAMAQAAAEAWQQQVMSVFADPEVSLKYAEIKAQWGEDDANLYLQGKLQQLQTGVATKQQEAQAQFDQQAAQEYVSGFQKSAYARAAEYVTDPSLKSEVNGAFAAAWQMYAAEVEMMEARGEPVQLTEEGLFKYYEVELMKNPRVQAAVQAWQQQNAQAERERIQREATEAARTAAASAELVNLQDATNRRSTLPPHVPSQVATGVSSQTITPVDRTRMSPDQLKRMGRDRAREIGQSIGQR